jgi:hypothetical protein
LKCLAFLINAPDPTITDPTGVDNPFEKHNDTESNNEQYSATVIFSATTAFHKRAPMSAILL